MSARVCRGKSVLTALSAVKSDIQVCEPALEHETQKDLQILLYVVQNVKPLAALYSICALDKNYAPNSRRLPQHWPSSYHRCIWSREEEQQQHKAQRRREQQKA
jgi:hypothetical protein